MKKDVNRKDCFFAHKRRELCPLYTSTGSGEVLPRSSSAASSIDFSTVDSETNDFSNGYINVVEPV